MLQYVINGSLMARFVVTVTHSDARDEFFYSISTGGDIL